MSENQTDENQFIFDYEDLEELRVVSVLRTHMNLVISRVAKMFITIYGEMERILNTPRGKLVEMARKYPTILSPRRVVSDGLENIYLALNLLRRYWQKFHIVSIPIQGIWIYRAWTALRIVTIPELYYPSRSPIYDVLPSECIVLFHPVSFYVPKNYLGSAVVSAIASCVAKHRIEFMPSRFKEAMAMFSEIARPQEAIDIRLDEKEAEQLLSDLKGIGIRLVPEVYLYGKILRSKRFSKLLLEKSIVERIPPVA